jgi:hypothetical protein
MKNGLVVRSLGIHDSVSDEIRINDMNVEQIESLLAEHGIKPKVNHANDEL